MNPHSGQKIKVNGKKKGVGSKKVQMSKKRNYNVKKRKQLLLLAPPSEKPASSDNPAVVKKSKKKSEKVKGIDAKKRRNLTYTTKKLDDLTCKECGKLFQYPYMLKLHQECHNVSSRTCRICGKICDSNRHLSSHLIKQHPNREKPYKCSICDKTYESTRGRRAHEKTHKDNCEYKCSNCQKVFTKRSSFLTHRSRKHPTLVIQECNICTLRFNTSKSLEAHLRFHEGVRPYKCTACDYTSWSTSNLRTHLKKVHSRDWESALIDHDYFRTITSQPGMGLKQGVGERQNIVVIRTNDEQIQTDTRGQKRGSNSDWNIMNKGKGIIKFRRILSDNGVEKLEEVCEGDYYGQEEDGALDFSSDTDTATESEGDDDSETDMEWDDAMIS